MTSYRAPRAVLEQDRKHEAYGEPLPAGAIARLGSKKLHSGVTVVVGRPWQPPAPARCFLHVFFSEF
jgi:hypothetical protein